MKQVFTAIAIFIFLAGPAASVQADLNNFLSDLNIQAKADMKGYSVKLSTQFAVPLPQVQSIIKSVDFPADAFMCLHLSRITNIQSETVLQTYKGKKGKGWGVIAKELGIKPGSAEFHALKRGDFKFTGKQGGNSGVELEMDKGKSKEKDKNKGKDKSKGKGHKK